MTNSPPVWTEQQSRREASLRVFPFLCETSFYDEAILRRPVAAVCMCVCVSVCVVPLFITDAQ